MLGYMTPGLLIIAAIVLLPLTFHFMRKLFWRLFIMFGLLYVLFTFCFFGLGYGNTMRPVKAVSFGKVCDVTEIDSKDYWDYGDNVLCFMTSGWEKCDADDIYEYDNSVGGMYHNWHWIDTAKEGDMFLYNERNGYTFPLNPIGFVVAQYQILSEGFYDMLTFIFDGFSTHIYEI